MRTAATRLLILLLVVGAVLALPGGLLAAAGAQSSGCPHCRSAGSGLVSPCCCCQNPAEPGHCGSGSCSFSCPFGSGGPACLSIAMVARPAWQATPYLLTMIDVSSIFSPPNIFHPPEPSHS